MHYLSGNKSSFHPHSTRRRTHLPTAHPIKKMSPQQRSGIQHEARPYGFDSWGSPILHPDWEADPNAGIRVRAVPIGYTETVGEYGTGGYQGVPEARGQSACLECGECIDAAPKRSLDPKNEIPRARGVTFYLDTPLPVTPQPLIPPCHRPPTPYHANQSPALEASGSRLRSPISFGDSLHERRLALREREHVLYEREAHIQCAAQELEHQQRTLDREKIKFAAFVRQVNAERARFRREMLEAGRECYRPVAGNVGRGDGKVYTPPSGYASEVIHAGYTGGGDSWLASEETLGLWDD
ncbi:hypothetical protein DM02DRAFT_90155 [Periconia macrospinosa]|uniref:4Fe-4S ferredoxin-type domain-containing protein n=1 Tax=Periconia macrospinosa TaxID=97972 RepID=A0A2V1DHW9_9PLEO|nr:hypothetical protein DM02DRAFT_90155 [Periconia macrospinosa]